MASSSKPRPPSSKEKSRAGKTRVISVKRTDVLPRKGSASTGRRKPAVKLPIEPLPATPAVDSKPKNLRPQRAEAPAARKRTTRATGRAPDKRTKPGATEVILPGDEVSPEATPSVMELEVDASAIIEETTIVPEMTIVEAPVMLPVEAAARPSSAPPPHPRRTILATVISRLLTWVRWTGMQR